MNALLSIMAVGITASQMSTAKWFTTSFHDHNSRVVACKQGAKDGTPERIRTSDLVFRKHPLYPTELREHKGGDLPLGQT